MPLKPRQKHIASVLGWLIGAVLFAGLNLYLLLKKFRIGGSREERANKTGKIIRIAPVIRLGELPGEAGGEKSYTIPEKLHKAAKSIVLEIVVAPQHNRLSQELEFCIFTENDRRQYFFLFLKPFRDKPELSYAREEIMIDIPKEGAFKIRLERKMGVDAKITGEVKITGYC